MKASITAKGKETIALPAPQTDIPAAGEGIDLFRKVEAADGKLDVKDGVVKKLVDRVIRGFLTDDARPHGKRLAVEYYSGYKSPVRAKASIEDHLEDFIERPTIMVPASVATFHPVVRAFVDDTDWKFVSQEHVPRAARIMQAFILECERQGWSVKKLYRFPIAGGISTALQVNDGQFMLKTAETSIHLLIREIPARNAPDVPDTERYARNGKQPPWTQGRTREFVSAGPLELLEKGYRHLVMRDGIRGKMEEQLPDFIVVIAVHDMAYRISLEAREREEQDKQQRWEAAMNRARVAFRQESLLNKLNQEAKRWVRWKETGGYLASLEAKLHEFSGAGRIEMKQWIAESRAVNEMQNPYAGAPSYPANREPTSDELKPYRKGWSLFGPCSLF